MTSGRRVRPGLHAGAKRSAITTALGRSTSSGAKAACTARFSKPTSSKSKIRSSQPSPSRGASASSRWMPTPPAPTTSMIACSIRAPLQARAWDVPVRDSAAASNDTSAAGGADHASRPAELSASWSASPAAIRATGGSGSRPSPPNEPSSLSWSGTTAPDASVTQVRPQESDAKPAPLAAARAAHSSLARRTPPRCSTTSKSPASAAEMS